MIEMVFKLAGGIGLFLLGMVLLPGGLKAFASGTFVTILVQSSSATMVTVIGFVSAGLITFPRTVGVVLGQSSLQGKAPEDWLARVERVAAELAEQRRQERPAVLRQTADGTGGPARALETLDAMRWLDRVGCHAWRVCNYLGGDGLPETTAPRPGLHSRD